VIAITILTDQNLFLAVAEIKGRSRKEDAIIPHKDIHLAVANN